MAAPYNNKSGPSSGKTNNNNINNINLSSKNKSSPKHRGAKRHAKNSAHSDSKLHPKGSQIVAATHGSLARRERGSGQSWFQCNGRWYTGSRPSISKVDTRNQMTSLHLDKRTVEHIIFSAVVGPKDKAYYFKQFSIDPSYLKTIEAKYFAKGVFRRANLRLCFYDYYPADCWRPDSRLSTMNLHDVIASTITPSNKISSGYYAPNKEFTLRPNVHTSSRLTGSNKKHKGNKTEYKSDDLYSHVSPTQSLTERLHDSSVASVNAELLAIAPKSADDFMKCNFDLESLFNYKKLSYGSWPETKKRKVYNYMQPTSIKQWDAWDKAAVILALDKVPRESDGSCCRGTDPTLQLQDEEKCLLWLRFIVSDLKRSGYDGTEASSYFKSCAQLDSDSYLLMGGLMRVSEFIQWCTNRSKSLSVFLNDFARCGIDIWHEDLINLGLCKPKITDITSKRTSTVHGSIVSTDPASSSVTQRNTISHIKCTTDQLSEMIGVQLKSVMAPLVAVVEAMQIKLVSMESTMTSSPEKPGNNASSQISAKQAVTPPPFESNEPQTTNVENATSSVSHHSQSVLEHHSSDEKKPEHEPSYGSGSQSSEHDSPNESSQHENDDDTNVVIDDGDELQSMSSSHNTKELMTPRKIAENDDINEELGQNEINTSTSTTNVDQSELQTQTGTNLGV
jgi:hypothetical protein